jgi:hypothetical protein
MSDTLRDVLDKIFTKLTPVDIDKKGVTYHESKPFISQLDQAETAITAYILGEVMELIGDDEKSKARPDKLRQSPPWQRNQLRQELRNKANKKFGGK